MGYKLLIPSEREAETKEDGSHLYSKYLGITCLIPTLGRWRQKEIWMSREGNIRQEETGAQGIQSEDLWRQDTPFGLKNS